MLRKDNKRLVGELLHKMQLLNRFYLRDCGEYVYAINPNTVRSRGKLKVCQFYFMVLYKVGL